MRSGFYETGTILALALLTMLFGVGTVFFLLGHSFWKGVLVAYLFIQAAGLLGAFADFVSTHCKRRFVK